MKSEATGAPLHRISRRLLVTGAVLTGLSGCATQTCFEGISGVSSIPGTEIFAPLVAVACIGAAHEIAMAVDLADTAAKTAQNPEETEEQRAERIAALESRAERDMESALELARETGNLTYLQKFADDGDPDAIAALRSIKGDVGWAAKIARASGNSTYLEQLARAGNTEAAFEIAKITGDLSYLEGLMANGNLFAAPDLNAIMGGTAGQIAENARETGDFSYIERLANLGSSDAQFVIYQNLASNRKSLRKAWTYLCDAANKGQKDARIEIAWWHMKMYDRNPNDEERLQWLREDLNLQLDNRVAMMWFRLAETPHTLPSERAALRSLPYRLSYDESTQSGRMAFVWEPGDCPSAAHRLGPPDET